VPEEARRRSVVVLAFIETCLYQNSGPNVGIAAHKSTSGKNAGTHGSLPDLLSRRILSGRVFRVQDPLRAGDLVDLVWGLLDMSFEGRDDFFPKLEY
jgi:hypothetical protein